MVLGRDKGREGRGAGGEYRVVSRVPDLEAAIVAARDGALYQYAVVTRVDLEYLQPLRSDSVSAHSTGHLFALEDLAWVLPGPR